jgi:hypothetical protein
MKRKMNTLPRMYVNDTQAKDYTSKKDQIRERLLSRLHYHESFEEDMSRAYAEQEKQDMVRGVIESIRNIEQFREKTHVVFRKTEMGIMWKILPIKVNSFGPGFDGSFTKNYHERGEQFYLDRNTIFDCIINVVLGCGVFRD